MVNKIPALFLIVAIWFAPPSARSATNGAQGPQNARLVGRWRSDLAPTGFWIKDRFSDGRYAEKEFLDYDSSKPAEIVASWGRWKLVGGKYSEVIDGTTSPFLGNFVGHWLNLRVIRIPPTQFSYWTHDAQIRLETPESNQQRLLSIPVKRPKGNSPKRVIDTIRSVHAALPSWVNQ